MTHETPPQPEPLTASREMTPDELVAKAETFEVIDGAITIPALWPRLILERERAARLPVSGESEELREAARDAVVSWFAGQEYEGTVRDAMLALRAALIRSSEARTEPKRCAVCDHPMTEHRTPGAECIHARCSCDLAHDAVLARTEPEAEDG